MSLFLYYILNEMATMQTVRCLFSIQTLSCPNHQLTVFVAENVFFSVF